jgi:hypothetical protein
MAKGLNAIYKQTVGATAVSTISFYNIPQDYTDLMILFSTRRDISTGSGSMTLRFNGNSTPYSSTRWFGQGSVTGSGRTVTSSSTGLDFAEVGEPAEQFASSVLYIPNYTGSSFKTTNSQSSREAATLNLFTVSSSGLWHSTSPIKDITFYCTATSTKFTQGSTITVYGIKGA